MRFKNNYEVLEMIHTYEILSESNCSEIEQNNAEFVHIIMDRLDIYSENYNCLFRAIIRLTYGTPDHYKEIRETVCDYKGNVEYSSCLPIKDKEEEKKEEKPYWIKFL